MMMFDPKETARLIAQTREDDARMGDGRPWHVQQDRFDLEGPHWIMSGLSIVARVGDPYEEGERRARSVARLRNNARPLADQLEAAAKEIERLTKLSELEDRASSQLVDERDHREEQINAIADVLGDESEWSNLNDRGAAAADLAGLVVSERDQLRADVERLTKERDEALGAVKQLEADVEREQADARTTIEALDRTVALMRPVVDVAKDLYAALLDPDNEAPNERTAFMNAVSYYRWASKR